MDYEVIQIDWGTWSVEDGMVRWFLLAGEEKAVLIDSGMNTVNAKEIAEGILKESGLFPGKTPELILINTHGDMDHCAGNEGFEWFYLHEGDWGNYKRTNPDSVKMRRIKEGDVVDPGDRPLEIFEIPGHTFGSIAILDVNRRVLYAGDSVQDGKIFMFGGHRNLDEYPASLMKMQELEDRFDVVFASHADLKMEPDSIGELFDACESVFHGEVEPEAIELFGTKVHAYDCGIATFLIDPKRVFEDSDPEDEE